MFERLGNTQNPLAVGATVAGLALAATGCGGSNPEQPARSIDVDQAAALIKAVPIGSDSFAGGIRVSHYNPVPSHPEYSLWGLIQYCDRPGGNFIQLVVDQEPNRSDPADVTNMTRAVFVGHKAVCVDGNVSESELPRPAIPTPNGRVPS